MLAVPQTLLDSRSLTVADVVDLPEDLRYELINGRLTLTPSALPFHNYAGVVVANALDVGRPRECRPITHLPIVLNNRNQLRPDVVVLERRGFRRMPVTADDVLLAVEIISPSSVSDDRKERLKLYAYAGIPSYWLIDPRGPRITFSQFLLDDRGVYRRHQHSDELVTVDLPWEVTLDLPLLTMERDEDYL